MWPCVYSYSYWFVVIYLITDSFSSVASSQIQINQILSTDNKTELFCPELFSTSLQIDCFYGGNTTSCDEPMANGTVAKVKCKHFYYRDFLPYEELSCRNGSWNYPFLFTCEPVCGIKFTKWTPFVVKGKRAELGDFPWHIGLYIKRNEKHSHICGGSILSPKLVITAAHCFEKQEPRLYAVAAGKIYRDWDYENDEFAQYRDVVEILIENKYKGASTGFAADIAILVLNQVFILSDLIHPICVDYTSTIFDVTEINKGNIPGWGLTSEHGNRSDLLQYATLPLHSFDDCLETVPTDFKGQVTLDKVCAGYTNGTSVCEGDSGGGLVYPRMVNSTEQRYMLIGVVSTGPFNSGTCDSYQYTTFTTVAAHIHWVNHTKYRYETWSPYDYGCILPDYPSFGKYTINADIPSGTELGPGILVPQYAKLRYSCNPEYRIHGKEVVKCKEKIWNVNSYLPACFRTCPRLNSTDLDIEYISENVNVKYDDDMILHETRALLRCKDSNYELEEPAYNQTTCRDGEWTRNVLKCKPICGVNRRYEETNYVTDAVSREFPWNVGIYKKTSDSYELKCAGTIVSLFVILSGPGCVSPKEISEYVIIAGSANKNFNSLTDENQQKSIVFKVIGYHYFDITILKKRFNVTSSVLPVCFSPTRIRLTGNKLEIPFWSNDEDNLKAMQYDGKNIKAVNLKNNSIPTDVKAMSSGALVVPVKFASGSSYYMTGLGTVDELQNIGFYILLKSELQFIAQILEKNNLELYEINECVVPDFSPHLKTVDFNYRPGDIVLEGTRIEYTCDAWHDLYGTKETVCANGTWSYPKGKPYCIGCGISQLRPTDLNSSISVKFTTVPDKFPWYAKVYAVDNLTEKYICSGSIISSRIILVQYWNSSISKRENNSTFYLVRVGDYHWNSSLNEYAQEVVVDDVVKFGIYSDTLILILEEDLIISKHVLPICLDVTRSTVSLQQLRSLTGIVPYGDVLKGKRNNSRIKFLYLTQFQGVINVYNQHVAHFAEEQFICTSDEYWMKKLRGTALVNTFSTDFGDRFFLRYVFNFVDCANSKFYFVDILSLMDQIESIVQKYSYN